MISILIPVYKVEDYLSRCIDSVLSQDFQDWEMVLVDDGSPDRCPQICDEYARKDKRIKVVHKQNGGLVSARKAGFERARGEYVIFLDSDDWMLPSALTTCYNHISEGYDMVRYNPMRVTEKGEQWVEEYPFDEGSVETNEEYMERWFSGQTGPYLHNCIFKTGLFKTTDFDALIENNISVGEDGLTLHLIANRINRAKFVKKPVGVYYKNTESMLYGCIISFGYIDRYRTVYHEGCDAFLPEAFKRDTDITEAHGDLTMFFKPEIGFDFKRFKKIQPYLKDLKGSRYNNYPARYYYFTWSAPLFFIYTMAYRFLVWMISMKFHTRKVLK